MNFSEFENLDLTTIVTPIKVDMLESKLKVSGYNAAKTEMLVDGFQHGFDLKYQGPMDRKDTAKNILFSVGDKFMFRDKIMKEVGTAICRTI